MILLLSIPIPGLSKFQSYPRISDIPGNRASKFAKGCGSLAYSAGTSGWQDYSIVTRIYRNSRDFLDSKGENHAKKL